MKEKFIETPLGLTVGIGTLIASLTVVSYIQHPNGLPAVASAATDSEATPAPSATPSLNAPP